MNQSTDHLAYYFIPRYTVHPIKSEKIRKERVPRLIGKFSCLTNKIMFFFLGFAGCDRQRTTNCYWVRNLHNKLNRFGVP
jgi:hypothetical protein